jgi:hypothetical protein
MRELFVVSTVDRTVQDKTLGEVAQGGGAGPRQCVRLPPHLLAFAQLGSASVPPALVGPAVASIDGLGTDLSGALG